MENVVTRQEHEEFARRQDAESEQQNRRIAELEENVKEIHSLTVSVERMAVNMENMLSAIERQGNLIEKQNNRINEIEREPAKDSKQLKMAIITSAVTTAVCAIIGALLVLILK